MRRALKSVLPRVYLDRLANGFQLSICQAAGQCGAAPARSRVVAIIASLSAWTADVIHALDRLQGPGGSAGGSNPAGTVLTPPGDKDQRVGPTNRSPCLSPEDQAKLKDRQGFVQNAIDQLQKALAGGAGAPDLGSMGEDQFYDWFKGALGGNVVTLGTNSGGTISVDFSCDPGDAFCEILQGETWSHEVRHGQNGTECQAGTDNGTCGTSGRDYANDELSAYSRSAEYLKNVKDKLDKKCSANSAPMTRGAGARLR